MPTEPDDSPWPIRDPDFADPVERRIRDAIARGEFDALPGAGKPIADLDRTYEPAWWAKRFVERSKREDALNELRQIVRQEAPRLRAATDREAATERARELNESIDAANATLPPNEQIPRITL